MCGMNILAMIARHARETSGEGSSSLRYADAADVCSVSAWEWELCVHARTYSCEELRILAGGAHVG
jgi:hypothetical protein